MSTRENERTRVDMERVPDDDYDRDYERRDYDRQHRQERRDPPAPRLARHRQVIALRVKA